MIKDILIIQKRELENRTAENYIKREVGISKITNSLIKVIVGPRRAGKSFFGVHCLRSLNQKFGYVNFDDERLVKLKEYDEILTNLDTLYGNPKSLLLDEIQNLPKWELFVNRLQRQGYNLFITGSNSNLLSRELATHLTGRHFSINILPFSFREYTQLEGKELTSSEIKERLNRYLLNGGYPEPLVKNIDYIEYLSTLFDSTVYKDIVKRYKIRDPKMIEELAFYLVSNISKEYTYTSLSKNLKIKSAHTIKKYLGYLEESFILFSLNRFSPKLKEQLSANQKIYCIDNGFVQAKAFKLSPDIGRLYENAVAIELKRRELNKKIKFYYWKNIQQEEVDFVVKRGDKIIQLIQVCFNISKPETNNREIRALLKASKELRCKNLLLITEDYEANKEVKWFDFKGKIKFVPLWKWLLEDVKR